MRNLKLINFKFLVFFPFPYNIAIGHDPGDFKIDQNFNFYIFLTILTFMTSDVSWKLFANGQRREGKNPLTSTYKRPKPRSTVSLSNKTSYRQSPNKWGRKSDPYPDTPRTSLDLPLSRSPSMERFRLEEKDRKLVWDFFCSTIRQQGRSPLRCGYNESYWYRMYCQSLLV